MASKAISPDDTLVQLARRFWRRIYWTPMDLRTRLAFFHAGGVAIYGHSLGDNIMLSAVAREFARRHSRKLAILTPFPELFAGNRFVEFAHPINWDLVPSFERTGIFCAVCHYHRKHENPDIAPVEEPHIIASMCRSAGIAGEIELVPELFLTGEERSAGKLAEKQVAIMSTGLHGAHRNDNKQWFVDRFQAVVDETAHRYQFVQVGLGSDPLLRGVIDRRGLPSLRQTAAILASSLAFVGQAGGLMHLARAAGCRSVVVFGGRELPDLGGYICNENLYTALPCSPCWRISTCDYDRECMRRITVEDVLTALERTVGRYGSPLEVQRLVL